MTKYCNFDTAASTEAYDFYKSDCYFDCVYYNGCNPDLLGDGKCDSACNNAKCGWDLGDCGYCADSCNFYIGYEDMLGNACYSSCKTADCYYGESHCKECSTNCTASLLGDGICDDACNNANCNFDFGDCDNNTCADNCYSWMINDGVCNSACYFSECDYDGTDCDCAPGCTKSMLDNDKCDAECNNSACHYDSGKCGDCNSDCFYENINDGVCQEACWVANCDYDGGDCQCSMNCNHTIYGQCNENCMTADCYYDQFSSDTSKHCKNTNLMQFYMHLQLVDNDLSTAQNINDCASKNCNTEMLLSTQNSCIQNCDSKSCAYSWLNCQPEKNNRCNDKNCKNCYGPDAGQCYTCNHNSSYQFYGYCLKTCPCGYTAKSIAGSYPLCLPSDDDSTMVDPTYYYVTSLSTSDQAGGNGTKENPFESLSLALTAINNKYSVIILLNDGVHYLTQLNKTNIMSVVAPDSSKPYNSQTHRKSLTITTENNYKVYLKPKTDWNILTITTQNTDTIIISNIIFDGNEWVHGRNNCLDNYCSYCPSITQQFDGSYKDDRGNVIINFTDSNQCQNFHNWNLIEAVNGITLTLYDVAFNNWRMEENSIIFSSGGTLKLYNVNFDNIRTNPNLGSAVVVLQNCLQNSGYTYGCGNFTYSGGNVTRVNNGFEYSQALTLKGFFRAARAQDVSFGGVIFENNAVYSSSSASDDSLIYLEIFRTLKIESCTFSYNVVYSALIFLKSTNLDLKSTLNSQNQVADYLIDHVVIEDTLFSYNYGFLYGIFAAQYQTELQNIYWNNVTLESNGAEKGPLIYIYNAVLLNKYIFGQTSTVTTFSGNKVKAYERYRTFNWDTITFLNNNSGGSGMWDFTKLVNLKLIVINVTENGISNSTVNSIVLSTWKTNTNIYLKSLISSPASLDFSSLASMSSIINFTIEDSKIQKNHASLSTPYILLTNSNITAFNNVIFDNNLGKSIDYPTVLYINGGNQTEIIDSTINTNINNADQGYGTIYAKGSDLILKIKKLNFFWNSANDGGGILFSGKSIYISNSSFTNNYAKTKGGALYAMQLESGIMTISIDSCNFTSNNALLSPDGAIYIENTGVLTNIITFAVKDSKFIQNEASYGAAIYIDSSVNFDQNKHSWLNSSSFIKNNSTTSGAIALYFLSGIFHILDCEFTSNVGRLGTSMHVEISTEGKSDYSRLLIEKTDFILNSGLAVIYMTNSDIYSHIITDSCKFKQNTATPLTLDYDYWKIQILKYLIMWEILQEE